MIDYKVKLLISRGFVHPHLLLVELIGHLRAVDLPPNFLAHPILRWSFTARSCGINMHNASKDMTKERGTT